MTFRAVPVFIVVLRGTITNLGMALRMAWPWLILILPLQIAVIPYLTQKSGSAQADIARGSSLALVASLLITFLAAASVAVNWHRHFLMDEEAAQRLRLDRRVWHYFGNALLLSLRMLIPMITLVAFIRAVVGSGFLERESVAAKVSIALVTLLGMVLPIAILLRVSLKFPAVALGRDKYDFRYSWHDTGGYFLGILGFSLLTAVFSSPMTVLFNLWTPDVQSGLAVNIFHAALSTAWGLFLALFTINTMTVFYAIFVEGVEV